MQNLNKIAQPSPFLRQTLLADAVITGVTGLLLAGGAGLLAGLLQLPADLLREAGLVLLPFVAYVYYVATRPQPSPAQVWIVIGLNALWVAASLALLAGGWVAPTLLGSIFVIGQALVVAVFAELQYLGLRRSTAAGG